VRSESFKVEVSTEGDDCAGAAWLRVAEVAANLPAATALMRELTDFRVTIIAKANPTFGAWTWTGDGHDNLALAFACWLR
jgi:hypothetical protein